MHNPVPVMSIAQLFYSRFRDGGRGEQDTDGARLYDCWGLCMGLYALHGIILPDFAISAFSARRTTRAFAAEVASGRWRALPGPTEYPCIVAIANTDNPRVINHFGTHVGGGRFVHILADVCVSVSHVTDAPWHKRIRGYYAWQL